MPIIAGYTQDRQVPGFEVLIGEALAIPSRLLTQLGFHEQSRGEEQLTNESYANRRLESCRNYLAWGSLLGSVGLHCQSGVLDKFGVCSVAGGAYQHRYTYLSPKVPALRLFNMCEADQLPRLAWVSREK